MHQLAGIGMTLMHGKLVTIFGRFNQIIDVGEGQFRVNALGEQVQPQRDDVDIAGPLTIAEQRAFNTVSPRHQPLLGGGNGGSPVIMGMQRQDHAVTAGEMTVHPFDLVSVDIRGGHFHRGRQVHDAAIIRGWLPDIHHRFSDLQRVFQLGSGETLWRILQLQVGAGQPADPVSDHFRAINGDLLHPCTVFTENHPALQGRGGIVDMQDGVFRPFKRIKSGIHQMFPRLGQDLNADIIRDMPALNQLTAEIEIGVRGRRETNLDFLETHFHQQLEHRHLAGAVHRFDKRLVAIAQVNTAPDRGCGDGA